MIPPNQRPHADRIRRLENLLADVTAKYGPDASLTRQVTRNLADARAAVARATAPSASAEARQ